MDFIPYGKQCIDEDDINEVVKVLRSDWITSGPKIKEFEDAICSYIGCKHCVVVNSGTSALDIAVQALGLPEGSEVITTPFTFAATSNALIYNGIKPVFADITKDTFNISPEDVKRKITKNTKAIIYVDFAGHPCDISELRKIADEYGLYLIEDACHAIGAEYNGVKVGNLADLTIFSFHPVKHITTGEGGAVVTENEELYKLMSLLRTHGIDRDARERYGPEASWAYDMKYLGRNYRMTDIQAALGISQLTKLDRFIESRSELASLYSSMLSNVDFVTTPHTKNGVRHAWHIYTILLDDSINRDEFFKYMRNSNIGVNLHYIPVYRHSYYRNNFDMKYEDFPVAEEIFRRIITIPLYPNMDSTQLEYVVKTIKEYR